MRTNTKLLLTACVLALCAAYCHVHAPSAGSPAVVEHHPQAPINVTLDEDVETLQQAVSELREDVAALKQSRVQAMRVTGYHPRNETGALGKDIRTGRTAAVSPACIEWLGLTVYVPGHGVWDIEDLTHRSVDRAHPGMCTLDLALPKSKSTKSVGNKVANIVNIGNY